MTKIIASTYELEKKLGSGGGGRVYLAKHLRMEQKVVLKADKRKITTKQEKLRREVDVLKELRHSHIPKVYDFFVENETVYTVMDYIEGESLDKPLQRGEKFSQPQVIKWAKQLLSALAYLHSPTHGEQQRGYVHSDIKPANIMKTTKGDICLIDFNVAFALGEEKAVGSSAGYASPEHYGFDFSTFGNDTNTVDDDETITRLDETQTITLESANAEGTEKKIVPDVRSDIYGVGATLYHLLSGKKPAKNAMEVEPLSKSEFSPQIVRIISKAMNPNPELRYQTAQDMWDELKHLHENDERTRRLKKQNKIAYTLIIFSFVLSTLLTFVGLKRMQIVEQWLKLAEYSQTALAEGDSQLALVYALQALPTDKSLLIPEFIAETQFALADALGIYDLADGFKKHKVVELPSSPLYMVIAPNGDTAACVYSGYVAVIDTEAANVIATLPADKSALTEVEYLNDDTIIYAGVEGIEVYNITSGNVQWSGKPCTAISISQDGKTVAAVYKNETFATIYDTKTGNIKLEVDFNGKFQRVTVNDIFANPNDNLFELNSDGSLLAVSFADGSLEVRDLKNTGNDIEIFDDTLGYTHFEGGFYEQYLAFSATGTSDSAFAVIDTIEKEQTGGFESDGYFGVVTDENGVYVQMENILVKIHPVTGEQTPLVSTYEKLEHFAISDAHTLVTSEDMLMFFDSNAELIASFEEEDTGDFVQMKNGIALIGSMDSPKIKIMKYENHSSTEYFSYDPTIEHDETRISADGKTVMFFSYKQFYVYGITGELINTVSIPNASQVYDQQFIREGNESYLEVTYNDGTVLIYNARNGELLSEKMIEQPDLTLYEEFFTKEFRIESPLHGTPTVYDIKSDKQICELEKDAYLTYVTQVDDYIITQYVTADGICYGVLLNSNCEKLAYLPYLCDILDRELFFDYPTGNIRKSNIYNIDDLIMSAKKELTQGGE